jgi:hypothetical protein
LQDDDTPLARLEHRRGGFGVSELLGGEALQDHRPGERIKPGVLQFDLLGPGARQAQGQQQGECAFHSYFLLC